MIYPAHSKVELLEEARDASRLFSEAQRATIQSAVAQVGSFVVWCGHDVPARQQLQLDHVAILHAQISHMMLFHLLTSGACNTSRSQLASLTACR